jgi:hypothetical protein
MRLVLILSAFAVFLSTSRSAQSEPTVEQLLDRMAAYLTEYEQQLSGVVADERFEQRLLARTVDAGGRPGSVMVQKLLESEIAFIRLPGGAEWLSFRDVRSISVEFKEERTLGLLVPATIHEEFFAGQNRKAWGDADHSKLSPLPDRGADCAAMNEGLIWSASRRATAWSGRRPSATA